MSDPISKKQTSSFQILLTGLTKDPPGTTYGPRIMKNYELIWIMQGEATIFFGKNKIIAKAGTILLRQPGIKDYYIWSDTQQTVHSYVHFLLDESRKNLLARNNAPFYRVMPPNDVFRPLFGYILNLNSLDEPLRSTLTLPTLDLMLLSYSTGHVQLKTQHEINLPEPMKKVVAFILKNIEKNPRVAIHLSDLTRVASTTSQNLCHIFKKYFDLSPLEYVKLTRLERAANFLRHTNMTLNEIALATGFYDSFHLSRSFKQIYEMSPKNFRNSPQNAFLTQKNPIIETLFYSFNPSYYTDYLKSLDETQQLKEKPKKNNSKSF